MFSIKIASQFKVVSRMPKSALTLMFIYFLAILQARRKLLMG